MSREAAVGRISNRSGQWSMERQCQTVARTVRPLRRLRCSVSNCEFTNCGGNKKNRTHVVPNETIATILFGNSWLGDMFSFQQY